jgi:hypothetical protein
MKDSPNEEHPDFFLDKTSDPNLVCAMISFCL